MPKARHDRLIVPLNRPSYNRIPQLFPLSITTFRRVGFPPLALALFKVKHVSP